MFLRHLNYMELIVMGTGSDVIPEAYLMSGSAGSNQNSGEDGGSPPQKTKNSELFNRTEKQLKYICREMVQNLQVFSAGSPRTPA